MAFQANSDSDGAAILEEIKLAVYRIYYMSKSVARAELA